MVKKNDSEASNEVAMSSGKMGKLLNSKSLMDSYSTSVQNPDKEFEILKQNIDKEIKNLLICNQIGLYEKINLILDDNVKNVKKVLAELIIDAPLMHKEFITKEITKCTNSRELFYSIKNVLLNFMHSAYEDRISNLFNNMQENKMSSEEFEQALSELNNDCIVFLSSVSELYTAKTTRPEVFKIEEEVRNMGVKTVKFSNDLQQAILIKEAVNDLIKAKIDLPQLIVVTPIIPMGTSGYNICAHKDDKNVGNIFLQTSDENKFDDFMKKGIVELASGTEAFKKASSTNKNKYINLHNNTHEKISFTQNSKHRIYHVIAHPFCRLSFEAIIHKLSIEEMNADKSVLKYAQKVAKRNELVPEAFVKLINKQKVTKEQIDLYLKLSEAIPEI